ncbi:MAG: hypothetical protein Q4G70_09560 [Pseudomonadota bacterium]|nr:hypothetical protein [Pseudomonadota bacterium]
MDKEKPLAVFYAGTNGSGKSTLRDSNPFPGLKVIDPDAIARGINPGNPHSVEKENENDGLVDHHFKTQRAGVRAR